MKTDKHEKRANIIGMIINMLLFYPLFILGVVIYEIMSCFMFGYNKAYIADKTSATTMLKAAQAKVDLKNVINKGANQ